jgi:hypothetical protein
MRFQRLIGWQDGQKNLAIGGLRTSILEVRQYRFPHILGQWQETLAVSFA